jgi:hypothetical protein
VLIIIQCKNSDLSLNQLAVEKEKKGLLGLMIQARLLRWMMSLIYDKTMVWLVVAIPKNIVSKMKGESLNVIVHT